MQANDILVKWNSIKFHNIRYNYYKDGEPVTVTK